MAREKKYLDRDGRAFDLRLLDTEERALVAELRRRAAAKPAWDTFEAYWPSAVAALYDSRGIARKDSRRSAVYQIAQDLSSRMAIASGQARRPDYRDELEQIIRSRFKSRRDFCRATGLSEAMLSHVLARRKHLAIDTLTEAMTRIGCSVHIVTPAKTG